MVEHTKRCPLPGCHAPPVGGRSTYCCPEHTRLGRNLANIRSRAKIEETQVLQDALDGKVRPPEHVGYLTTTQGVVLSGQALMEFRSAAGALRAAAAAADEGLGDSVSHMGLRLRVKTITAAANAAAAAVEKALRPTESRPRR